MLEVQDLKKYYPIKKGFFLRHVGDVKAVDGVSFNLQKGKTLGVLGESGCGKSTLGKALIRLFEPTEGKVSFNGHNFLEQKGKSLQRLRSSMQMIFQDPFGSLDPRMTVGNIIREPLEVHGIGNKSSQKEKVQELMAEVGLNPTHINRYPHEFSGGQRQRISIARCLALEPELIIADEPVSALDVSVQAQILNLMKDLQDKFGLTYIFISHDISVIDHMADDIMVMYLGKVVEQGSRESVLTKPQHPYTQALMNAIPLVGAKKNFKGQVLQGDVPSPINPPKGCTFHPRCPHAEDKCKIQMPDLKVGHSTENHKTRCWLNHKENEHVFQ